MATNKLRGRWFHSAFRFTDEVCALNVGVEFGKAFLEIYLTELELKAEHNGRHATFVDLDIYKDQGKLIYKIFDKRYTFNFHIVRMPSVISNNTIYHFL